MVAKVTNAKRLIIFFMRGGRVLALYGARRAATGLVVRIPSERGNWTGERPPKDGQRAGHPEKIVSFLSSSRELPVTLLAKTPPGRAPSETAGGADGCKSRSFWGVLASQVIRSDSLGFPWPHAAMAASLHLRLRLSPLPPVAAFLVAHAQGNEELQAQLDDGLEDYTQGAEVVLEGLRAGLDAWLEEGRETLYRTSQGAEPFVWLAISDHLEIVEQFRELL